MSPGSLSFFSPVTIYNQSLLLSQMEQELSLISKLRDQKHMKMRKACTYNHQSLAINQSSLLSGPKQISDESKIKHIEKKIQTISQAQQSLQEKCKRIIQSLTKEIMLKDDNNAKLEGDIEELKEELKASREDLQIIIGYLGKKKEKEVEKRGRVKMVLDSTKDSGQEKSTSGTKGSLTRQGASTGVRPRGRPTMCLLDPKVRRQKSNVLLI